MDLLRRKLKESTYLFRKGTYIHPEKLDMEKPFMPPDEERILSGNSKMLKKSGSVVSCFDKEEGAFIKIYRRNGFLRTLKRFFGFPRSYRCLAGALRLKELGIHTPEVWYASRFVLKTAFLPESVQFLNYSPAKIGDLMDLLVCLHHGGFVHGDLNYRNIYRTTDGRYGLIDLDSVQLYPGTLPLRQRMKELSRLVSSGLFFNRVSCWKEIRQCALDCCILYEEKSRLSCDRDFVIRKVCSQMRAYGRKHGIRYEEE